MSRDYAWSESRVTVRRGKPLHPRARKPEQQEQPQKYTYRSTCRDGKQGMIKCNTTPELLHYVQKSLCVNHSDYVTVYAIALLLLSELE